MNTERIIRMVAGSFILLSLALGMRNSPFFISENALFFTAFVGANLLQSAFTRWCLMESILIKLGVPVGTVHPSGDQSGGCGAGGCGPRGCR
jgi:pheromone shutdown protein TraB